VEVKDAVARVTVIPESRSDIKVEFLSTNPRLPLQLRSFGGKTIVDGDLGRRIRNCRGSGERTAVEGRLRLSQAGSGDTRAGAAAEAKIRTAGSGDVTMADVHGPLEVEIAGSGDVNVGAIAGTLDVRVAGSGDVKVAGGHANAMNVSIAGSGDVDFGGTADTLKARIMGSGDVHARAVKGPISKMVMGSGGVSVGS
jgi:hypothetical protein